MNFLNEVSARLDAASPRPWVCDGFAETGHTSLAIYPESNQNEPIANSIDNWDNAHFFMEAPKDVARLLAALYAVSNLLERSESHGNDLLYVHEVWEAIDSALGEVNE